MIAVRCLRHGRAGLAWLALLTLLCAGGAVAQTGPSAKGAVAPATLRLAQVVPRLPTIHLYAIAQDESGRGLPLQSGLSALIGGNSVPVSVSQQHEGIAVVFLIDISGSIRPPQFELIKRSVLAWIESLDPSDRAAVVAFGSSVSTRQDFTADKQLLRNAVTPLTAHDPKTLLYQGLVQAIDLSQRLDEHLPLRRGIVVLTDGLDDQQGGAGRQEVLDKLSVDPTPIYGIGASPEKSTAVDEALKSFSALVRASGGDFRRVDMLTLDKGYLELRNIVRATQHLIGECRNPPCAPDGSATVVRLFMDQGGARLSTAGVTVRAVGEGGKVQPAAAPTPAPLTPAPPMPAAGAPVPATPAPVPKVEIPTPPPAQVVIPPRLPPVVVQPSPFQAVLKFFLNAPMQWLAVLALIAGSAVAGLFFLLQKGAKPKEAPKPQEPTKIIDPGDSGMIISKRVEVQPGTQQNRQRLRLFPVGRNDIGPWDLLFEQTLAVGRSPDSEICISNDGQVSSSHCNLSPQGQTVLVQDGGSRNGTRVNGVPINGLLHAESDSILGVGRTELRMKLLPVGAQ